MPRATGAGAAIAKGAEAEADALALPLTGVGGTTVGTGEGLAAALAAEPAEFVPALGTTPDGSSPLLQAVANTRQVTNAEKMPRRLVIVLPRVSKMQWPLQGIPA